MSVRRGRGRCRLRILAFSVLVPLAGVGCGTGVSVDAVHRFEEANRTFEQARDADDYLRAATLYQSILEDGCQSGAVLYDLGNAYLRAGRIGQAIAAYRQAKRFLPRDELLEANLRQALGPERSRREDERDLIEHVLFWQRSVSYREKMLAVAVAASASFLLGMLARLVRSRRRPLGRVAAAMLLVTGVLGLSCGLDAYQIEGIRHGVITAGEVVARKGDAQSYEPAFTEPLEEGAEFVVEEERGAWIRIRLDGRLDGWVPRDKAVLY